MATIEELRKHMFGATVTMFLDRIRAPIAEMNDEIEHVGYLEAPTEVSLDYEMLSDDYELSLRLFLYWLQIQIEPEEPIAKGAPYSPRELALLDLQKKLLENVPNLTALSSATDVELLKGWWYHNLIGPVEDFLFTSSLEIKRSKALVGRLGQLRDAIRALELDPRRPWHHYGWLSLAWSRLQQWCDEQAAGNLVEITEKLA